MAYAGYYTPILHRSGTYKKTRYRKLYRNLDDYYCFFSFPKRIIKAYLNINGKKFKVMYVVPYILDQRKFVRLMKLIEKFKKRTKSNVFCKMNMKIDNNSLYLDNMTIEFFPQFNLIRDKESGKILSITYIGRKSSINVTKKFFKSSSLDYIDVIEVKHHRKLVEFFYFKKGRFLGSKKKHGYISKLAEIIDFIESD